ncbi:MAG: hypothetical protein IJX70_05760 [Clostridia bacterium]|nr:hypothetical protein [Clostridia bacterium]
MAEKSNGTKVVVGLALLAVLRLIWTIIRETVKVLARVIVYFGLYVPFFYGIFGVVMVALGQFEFEVFSLNTILYYVGLTLCFGVSVGLFIRSYGRKPISSVTAGSADAIRAARRRRPARVREVKADPAPAEKPLFVYHSEVHPDILVHEYADRFDLYRDDRVNPITFDRTVKKSE